jgi:hypothetical protein
MAEMKDVQQLINDRADAKLKKEVKDISRILTTGVNYELLKNIVVILAHMKNQVTLGYAGFLAAGKDFHNFVK